MALLDICAMRCPSASFIGFTGTPNREGGCESTRAVFGDNIESVYDIQSVLLPMGRRFPSIMKAGWPKLELKDPERTPKGRSNFPKEATEGEEVDRKEEKLKSRWAAGSCGWVRKPC